MIALRGVSRRGLYLLPVLALLMLSGIEAYAQNDSRMIVEITKDEQGVMPSVQNAIGLALPLLWDRIIPVASRTALSDSVNATQFLQRVVPHGGGLQVIFNEQRVYQYLDQQQVAYLKEAPHLNIDVRMFNQSDLSMPKTIKALQVYAGEVAKNRGIVLDSAVPVVTATWRWLDNGQLSLNVSGEGLSEPVSEVRPVSSGKELEQLQAWVAELMLRLRDGGLTGETAPEQRIAEMPQRNEADLLLTIEQPATLSEQVVLEESLRQNGKVESLLPVNLSANSRQYHLRLKGNDDSWIESWFRRRGMQAQPTAEGWLVR